ncbi:dUTP diphosphatase [Mycoplasmopsis columbinasalis]|uniref:Uncharacterized protein conserved in bacteria n=1 Tax=Mycoplasmopsis columbinasalis TaxID=114880 RepID=A0A449BAJ7_9BACT|nr:dUTP diphosphatase [Mycoplasmopsis columbinasalis]VEU78232.1 Uncharacterized protein conserved in bacteria [Mycoplasmopsis columbinasalis]
MNLKEIFTLQQNLDEQIAKRSDLNFASKPIQNRQICIALLVEWCELANEVSFFKYWKAQKHLDRSKALEELADVLHFLTTLSYKTGVSAEINPYVVPSQQLDDQFCAVSQLITQTFSQLTKTNIHHLYELVLGFAQLLNFSENEILEAYRQKNKINHQRIYDHY